jgi:hypothetical protein
MNKKPDNVVDFGLANMAREAGMPVPAEENRRKIEVEWADDIRLDVDQPGLIDGQLPATGILVVYGESGAGKSFVALNASCCIGAGRPWHGHEVERGIVIYVAAENPKSIRRRIWAWKQRHGVEHLPVLVVKSTVDLLNGDADALVALVTEVAEEHGKVAMVVVDTLARAMTGNENAPEDMGRFVAACDRIREAGDCLVMIVHHCGKDTAKGARGHSSLRAATDVEWEVTKGENGRGVTVRKNRDGEEGVTFGFTLETVELGENAKGRMVTTCVTAEAEAPTRKEPKKALGKRATICLKALETALAHAGEKPPDHEAIRHVTRSVTLDTWHRYFGHAAPYKDGSSAKREAWRAGTEELMAAQRVGKWGEYVWPR